MPASKHYSSAEYTRDFYADIMAFTIVYVGATLDLMVRRVPVPQQGSEVADDHDPEEKHRMYCALFIRAPPFFSRLFCGDVRFVFPFELGAAGCL